MCLDKVTDGPDESATGIGYKIVYHWQGELIGYYMDVKYTKGLNIDGRERDIEAMNEDRYRTGFHVYDKLNDATYSISQTRDTLIQIWKVRCKDLAARGYQGHMKVSVWRQMEFLEVV